MMIHQNSLVVDGHCDTILFLFEKKRSFWAENNKGHLDWPRLKTGKINLQFMAIYIEPEYKPSGSLARVLELLNYFNEISKTGAEPLKTVLRKNDLYQLTPEKHAFLLAIEGGEVLEGKIAILPILFSLGFRCLTLTWNQRNQLGDGVWEKESCGGLTGFGRQVVREMNRLGMLVDVSHLTEAGFWDVLSESSKPIAATHSCCRALFDHPRNLSDAQLKALGEKDGIVGINFYPGFLGGNPCTIDTVVKHLEHAVETAGIQNVGLGSDFDGINKTPRGLEHAGMMPRLTEALQKRGWREDDIRKVIGGNFIRVLERVMPD